MIFRCNLLGTGTYGDKYRPSLPTYRTIAVDPVAGTITVEVPDECLPPGFAAAMYAQGATPSQAVTSLTANAHAAWHSWLDRAYQERRGEFRPIVG